MWDMVLSSESNNASIFTFRTKQKQNKEFNKFITLSGPGGGVDDLIGALGHDLGDELVALHGGGRVHVAVVDGAGDADVGHAVGHEGVRVGRVPGALWRYGGK